MIDWRPQGTKPPKINKQTRSFPNYDKVYEEENRNVQVSGDEAIGNFLDNLEDDDIEVDDYHEVDNRPDPTLIYSQLRRFRTTVSPARIDFSFDYKYGSASENEKCRR